MFEISKALKKANVTRTIRFTESLFEELCQTAQDHGVSMNRLVLACCVYALSELKKEELS